VTSWGNEVIAGGLEAAGVAAWALLAAVEATSVGGRALWFAATGTGSDGGGVQAPPDATAIETSR
jgi:hypothetical protein